MKGKKVYRPAGCRQKRVGVLGGTFDPIHNGHLAVARFVMSAVELDEVVFVPAGRPWMKESPPAASAEDRLEMVRLAVSGESGFSCSDVDVRRDAPTYTLDTLQDLLEEYVRAAKFFLIVGADTAMEMHRWKDAHRLRAMSEVIVAGRPGTAAPGGLADHHPARGAIFLEGPMKEVSASAIRDMLSRGEPPIGLVPDRVARYMADRGLYGLALGAAHAPGVQGLL